MQSFSRVCVKIDFIVFNKWIWVKWFMASLICSFVSCGFVTDCQRGKLLGHMCFLCYRTYAMFLCNWLILWQNALYLYLSRLRMCLTTSRNHVLRSSVEAFKFVQEIKQESANSLKLDSWSIPYWHLYLSRFKNFRFQLWFSWDPWICFWAFFSSNPRHIKGLF